MGRSRENPYSHGNPRLHGPGRSHKFWKTDAGRERVRACEDFLNQMSPGDGERTGCGT